MPRWTNLARQESFARQGIPGFLSVETYKETYEQYVQHLIDQLNTLTVGTVDEDQTAHALHIKYAHRADKAHLYNVAAMLNNTRFFWEDSLSEKDDKASRKPGLLTMRSIEASFGSVATLREELLETADAMFGNGFVWLMKGKGVGDLKILATYNTGSPYKEAAPRRDDRNMANVNMGSLSEQLSQSGLGQSTETRDILTGNSSAGYFGNHSANRSKNYAGLLNMSPILCVNVWEHQWIRDYGLLGKKWYLGAWWDHIDWQKVEMNHNILEDPAATFSHNPAAYRNSGGASVLDALNG
jgi:superoxide dismutase, Fe-Mn family